MRPRLLRFLAPALLAAGQAAGQSCPATFGDTFAPRYLSTSVLQFGCTDSIVFDDDGPGPHPPRLYLCGDLLDPATASACGVVVWDGHRFTRVGSNLRGSVFGLAVFDFDGPGPQSPTLCAIGQFDIGPAAPGADVARWTGSTWVPIGDGLPPIPGVSPFAAGGSRLLSMDEDGAGPLPPTLFAIRRVRIDLPPAAYSGLVYRLDGAHWTQIQTTDCPIAAAVLDASPLPSLFIATASRPDPYTLSGGARILRRSGGAWSELQNQPTAYFSAMIAFDDDGPGPIPPALYIGGTFANAGGPVAPRLARSDGQSFEDVPAPTLPITALAALDPDGAASQPTTLYAATYNASDGTALVWPRAPGWYPIINTVGYGSNLFGRIKTVAAFDEDDAGPHPVFLFAAGSFYVPGAPYSSGGIAKWPGDRWVPPGDGLPDSVTSILSVPSASGPQLFIGGAFTTAGGVPAHHIGRWDGSWWRTLGQGLDSDARAMCIYDDGSGPAVFVGGTFTMANGQPAGHIAKWTGSTWQTLGAGLDGDCLALCVYDDGSGPALYAGGSFSNAGGQPATSIARWRAGAWSPVGSGADGPVQSLCAFDPGTGPRLYAGGHFTQMGSTSAYLIASWDGAAWQPLGDGIRPYAAGYDHVSAMVGWTDGPAGSAGLYAAGLFGGVAGHASNSIARWDGQSWWPMGTGLQTAEYDARQGYWYYTAGYVGSLAIFRDAPGAAAALYACGSFNCIGPVPPTAGYLARWDGAYWSTPYNAPGAGFAAAVHDPDGPGPRPASLFLGGWRLDELVPCDTTCYANCDGSVALPVLNVNDFVCFLNKFAAGDPYANCDNSTTPPTLNILDFICFLNRFAAGCP